MPIELQNQVVIPATAEKVANSIWIKSLFIAAPDSNGKVVAVVAVAPYISATNEVLWDLEKSFTIDDVFTAMQTDASLAQAVGAIYQTVQNQVNTLNLFQN